MKNIFTEKLSLIIIVIGILFSFLFIYLFRNTQSIDSESTTRFGALFGAVVCGLWSLAGVILFYIALKRQTEDFKRNAEILTLQKEELGLQREELKMTREVFQEQSKTMKLQQSEATYFHLLENHRGLVLGLSEGELLGYELLESIYAKAKRNIPAYKRALKDEETRYNLAYCSPFHFLKDHRETIIQISNNIINIIDLINEGMNNSEFYHRTLYNTLSPSEKYIFGMYYHLEIKDAIYFKAVTKANFDYSIYYKSSPHSYYERSEGVMPLLERTFSKFKSWRVNKHTKDDFPMFHLKSIDEKSIFIKRYMISVDDFKRVHKSYSFDIDKELQPYSEVEFDIYNPLYGTYVRTIEQMIEARLGSEIGFGNLTRKVLLRLDLQYQGRDFTYNFDFEILVQNPEHSETFIDFSWR